MPTEIPPVRTRSAVAILGFVDPGLVGLPTADPGWEIWGLNSGWWYPRDAEDRLRADRWFELHEMSAQTPEEIEAIRACPLPIYLTDPPTRDIPNGIRFPLEDLDARFGKNVPYACTFAYQIAFAITLGFSTIGLFGVELQLGTLRERTVERSSVAYWAGYARGLGVEVIAPPGSGVISHPHRYGFDYNPEKDAVEIYAAETAAVAGMFLARRTAKYYFDRYGQPLQFNF